MVNKQRITRLIALGAVALAGKSIIDNCDPLIQAAPLPISERAYNPKEEIAYVIDFDSGLETNENSRKIVISKKLIDIVEQLESSGGRNLKDSIDGARGRFQIMPNTWREMTIKVYGEAKSFELARDPEMNEEIGVAYLHQIENYLSTRISNWDKKSLLERQELVIAGYHGGPSALANKYGEIFLKWVQKQENMLINLLN